jgi:hypothetical protein
MACDQVFLHGFCCSDKPGKQGFVQVNPAQASTPASEPLTTRYVFSCNGIRSLWPLESRALGIARPWRAQAHRQTELRVHAPVAS